LNTDSLTLQSGHLAWCALVALHLARQDGIVNSDAQANLFLTRWLATAQKQRRFSREIAPDIEWLLKKGRTLGVNAKLGNKLDYLWRSCTGELSEQNDLFRLTYAFETARDTGWVYQVLSDKEWTGRYALTLNAEVSGVYLSRTSLEVAFNDEGGQIMPVMVRLTGNVSAFETVINRCDWRSEASTCDGLTHLYTLTAVKSAPDICSDTNRMST
jgi:hypothetical protein